MTVYKMLAAVAYFTVCTCKEMGLHAHIVLPDGRASPTLLSKRECGEVLNALRVAGEVKADEEDVVRDMIYDSPLPTETPQETELYEGIVDDVVYQLSEDEGYFGGIDEVEDAKEMIDSTFFDPDIVSHLEQ